MEFKGTKGVWTTRENFDKKYNQPTVEIDCGEDTCSLATVWTGNIESGEMCNITKANALLISKAPEMLLLLCSMVDNYENTNMNSSNILTEALKKAKLLIKEATEL